MSVDHITNLTIYLMTLKPTFTELAYLADFLCLSRTSFDSNIEISDSLIERGKGERERKERSKVAATDLLMERVSCREQLAVARAAG